MICIFLYIPLWLYSHPLQTKPIISLLHQPQIVNLTFFLSFHKTIFHFSIKKSQKIHNRCPFVILPDFSHYVRSTEITET